MTAYYKLIMMKPNTHTNKQKAKNNNRKMRILLLTKKNPKIIVQINALT